MIQLVLMTGQSDRRSCALSPVQSAFLERLAPSNGCVVPLNFPYVEGMAPHRRRPLVAASISNALQALGSRSADSMAPHRPRFLGLLEAAPHTVVLAGSCGLELFNRMRLPSTLLASTSVFAYGPVALGRPSCRFVSVQGRRDWLSRATFRHGDHFVDGGHLDYLADPEVLRLARAFIAGVIVAPTSPSTP